MEGVRELEINGESGSPARRLGDWRGGEEERMQGRCHAGNGTKYAKEECGGVYAAYSLT